MREKYELMSVAALKELAKSRGLKGLSGMKKSDLVDVLVSEDAKNSQAGEEKVTGQTPSEYKESIGMP